jgi:MFS family permease
MLSTTILKYLEVVKIRRKTEKDLVWRRKKEKISIGSFRSLLMEGIASNIMFSLITVPFITLYLISVNADPSVIGLVAAIPFISQLAQIPSAIFAEKFSRKSISIIANFISRASLLLIGILLYVNQHSAMVPFVILFAIYNIFKEVYIVAWNSWMRDLIPLHIRGELYSKRIAYRKLAGSFVVLAFAIMFSVLGSAAFALVFLVAFVAGMVGLIFMRKIEDVEIEYKGNRDLKKPLKDSNFLKLTIPFSLWKFASEMSLPFYSVYIISVLKYPLWAVIALTTISNLSSTYFLRISGRIMDRFGNKPVMILSFISFSMAVFIFTFTTMPEEHPLSPLLLLVIYMLDGFYTSIPFVASMNMIAKITARGSSASYYAVHNVMASSFAALGSISGGLIASIALSANFAVKIDIESSMGFVEIPAIHLAGYDFLFVISAALSLIAAKLLRFFREEGESGEDIVKEEIKHAVFHDVQTIMAHMHIHPRWFVKYNVPYAIQLRTIGTNSNAGYSLQHGKSLEDSTHRLT